jgi:hypothetical protein
LVDIADLEQVWFIVLDIVLFVVSDNWFIECLQIGVGRDIGTNCSGSSCR